MEAVDVPVTLPPRRRAEEGDQGGPVVWIGDRAKQVNGIDDFLSTIKTALAFDNVGDIPSPQRLQIVVNPRQRPHQNGDIGCAKLSRASILIANDGFSDHLFRKPSRQGFSLRASCNLGIRCGFPAFGQPDGDLWNRAGRCSLRRRRKCIIPSRRDGDIIRLDAGGGLDQLSEEGIDDIEDGPGASKVGREPAMDASLIKDLVLDNLVGLDIRPPESVNGLFRIAHHKKLPGEKTDVPPPAASPARFLPKGFCKKEENLVLNRIGILKFVD